MNFDEQGNRIVARTVNPSDDRESAYWFEQEKVDDWGFCDAPITCNDSDSVTHLCSRFKGHSGQCEGVHKGTVAGRKVRRLEP